MSTTRAALGGSHRALGVFDAAVDVATFHEATLSTLARARSSTDAPVRGGRQPLDPLATAAFSTRCKFAMKVPARRGQTAGEDPPTGRPDTIQAREVDGHASFETGVLPVREDTHDGSQAPQPGAWAQSPCSRAASDAVLRVVARARHRVVIMDLDEVWAFEAKDRLCFVHSIYVRSDVDISLCELESSLDEPFVRVHRCWLANIANVREFDTLQRVSYVYAGNWPSAKHQSIRVPIARECATALRERLLTETVGLRRRPRECKGDLRVALKRGGNGRNETLA
jgi:hypothetical protein